MKSMLYAFKKRIAAFFSFVLHFAPLCSQLWCLCSILFTLRYNYAPGQTLCDLGVAKREDISHMWREISHRCFEWQKSRGVTVSIRRLRRWMRIILERPQRRNQAHSPSRVRKVLQKWWRCWDRITEKIPVAKMVNKYIDIPADDESAGKDIHLFIGNDYYSSFMRDEKIEMSPNLYVINTDFGWILSGNTDVEEKTSALTVTTYCQCHVPSCPYFTEPDLPLRSIDVNFLWSLESIGITDNPKATRQEEAVKHFMETVQYHHGRYYIKWPWIQYPPELSSNFGLAIGRLKSMLKKIDEETLHEYDSILKEQLQSGIIEEIDPKLDRRSDQLIHYLPHHMVKQKGKKGRLVYDASAKTSGQKSLNECLYSGPSFLEDLTALLLKFRMKKIGVMADVEKAFLQVGLHDEDRDVTRFLWIKDVSKEPNEDNLMYLRFCRVPFGIICSPMLLTATIRHHMSQSTSGDLLKNIADKCYVDNLVTSADTVHEARQVYEQTRETFEQLGMNIRDWISNDEELMSTIPKAHQADQQEIVKVLGLSWNVNRDTLELKLSEDYFQQDSLTSTKRTVLRDMARIYDPLGFVCPLVLPMKILFQDICKLKLKWDVELPDNLKQVLKENLDILRQVKNVELPRYVGTGSPDTRYQVHAFTDASKNAFSCAVYIRGQNGHQVTVSFMMGKCRISRIEDKVPPYFSQAVGSGFRTETLRQYYHI